MNESQSIHQLVRDGNAKEVARLLAADRSLVCSHDEDGATLLHVTAQCGDVKIARLLLATGADVNSDSPKWKYTPLHRAAKII